jgi:nucleoside-diphosphate-sugar epimerase
MMGALPDVDHVLTGQTVLVTGASGFIGAHLTRRLVALGADVHVLLRPGSSVAKFGALAERIRVLRADLCDMAELSASLSAVKPRYVFHMAAYTNVGRGRDHDERAIIVNLLGTIHLLNALADVGVERVVNSGSCEEYGDRDLPVTEAEPLSPVSPYSVSKAAASMWCEMVFRTRGLPVTTIRPFLCYGSEQEAVRLIPQAILAALEDRQFPMTLGEQTREFTHVDDIVEGYIRAAVMPGAEGETFNLSSGEETSVRNAVDLIFKLTSSRGTPVFGALPYRQSELWRSCGDATKAREKLGWKPVIRFEDGIASIIPWYRDALRNGLIPSSPM